MNSSSCFVYFLCYNISCLQHTLFLSLILSCAHTLACVGHFTVLADLPHTVVVNSVPNILFICPHLLPNKSPEHFSPSGS